MKRNNQGQTVSSSAAGVRKEPFWRNGLRNSIKDAGLHLSKTDQAVLIKDKYPKVRQRGSRGYSFLGAATKPHLSLLQNSLCIGFLATPLLPVTARG